MAADVARPVTARGGRPAASARDPILSSKITVPGVPDWVVPRPRITQLIARGLGHCPLTVVTGPPGAGKTMALAIWAAAGPGPVAWISLDEYDNRPGVFWSYAVAALHRAGVTLPGVLPPAGRGRTAEHLFLLRLAEALAAQGPPVTLVLDDFHLLTQPKLLEGLEFVLRNTGPGLRLVICSRMDPLLPLYRYRLAGELAEIRASDLAFTVTETRLLLAQQRGHLRLVPPGPDQARAPLLVEPLTEREQEVLRHVSRMLSTAEVANEMYISTNTVKTHLKSIFRKLAAGHRGEAVRRARQLELI